MVVLAASICTKAGKAVVSRQFMEMPRSRIEGLLASFPKLMSANDQHTFVETDSVRYVYQPLEELYMVLITNKQSNILQDIDTLHLFARVVSDYCRSLDVREISRHAFELINVFDEVVSMGYRESITLAQIRTITEMESHDERIQAEIEKNKEKEAKDELKRKARMLEQQKREAMKRGASGGNYGGFGSNSGGFGGAGSGSGYSQNSGGFKTPGSYNQEPTPSYQTETSPTYSSPFSSTQQQSRAPIGGGKGMQLGKKTKNDAIVEAIKTDEGIRDIPAAQTTAAARSAAPVSSMPAVHQESVHVYIEEKVIVSVSRDGGVENMEIKGKMELRTTDSSKAHLRVTMKPLDDSATQFTMHPNFDKKLFPPNLALRDASRPFPINQAVGILKWRFQTKDDNMMPLSINCWPSPSGNGSCDVNIEYELQTSKLALRDVVIAVPYSGSVDPVIHSAEGHPYQIDRSKKQILWQIPLIDDSSRNGVLEFTVNNEDVGSFFPINVVFASNRSYCGVEVASVSMVDGAAVVFSQETILSTEDYNVV